MTQWLGDVKEQKDVSAATYNLLSNINIHQITNQEMEENDDVKPSDSVSNVEQKSTRSHSGKSITSSTTSSCIKTEADLAALMAKQEVLKQRHQLEEEEERLRQRKEQLKLEEEICAHKAKLKVLKSQSIASQRLSKASDGMNSYLDRQTARQKTLDWKADPFVPFSHQTAQQDHQATGTKPKEKAVGAETTMIKDQRHGKETVPSVHPSFHIQDTRNTNTVMDNQQSMLDIMRNQNEITMLLMDQQCVSSLPKRDVPEFDGDPLQYHMFMRAFENNVEKKTDNNSDRLYFLEQYTKGLSKELVRSCQYISPDRGYFKAKALLKEHFGNEHKVAAAYMDKVLSWLSIKTEDAKALQDYSLFLRSCCNVMEDLHYLHDLNVPANMLSVIKKLPYKFRDKWRTVACELQERTGQRCKISDITEFIEKQVRVLTDPVFGNIQDVPPATRSLTKPESHIRFGRKESSFATTVTPVNKILKAETQEKKFTQTLRKKCLFCGKEHILDSCEQLEKKSRKEKIGFLREKGVCFGCLCIGHISKDCKRRVSCAKCGFKHPTLLHITSHRKEETQDVTETEKKPEVQQMRTLVSNGLTGAGDQDCKLPIVPVQVKLSKGSKIVTTYAFLDQGSTAVFCTDSLMHRLNVEGRKTHILLRTMGQEKIVDSYVVNGLEVAAIQGNDFVAIPKTYTQPSIAVQKCNIPLQKDLQNWPYLKDIYLPQINEEIELLIGVNVPKALEPLQVIQSEHDGPFAIRTMLGWTINGPLGSNCGNTMDQRQRELSVNRVSVVQMDELWQKQFQIDFPECSMDEQSGLSQEDQKFMETVSNSANLINGHYQIGLPLRNKNVCMPNKKDLALQRVAHLKKRLQRDCVFYTTKGYAEQVPELKHSGGKMWYIPHHGV